MHCHQIQPLLEGYAAGSLPAYKVAWVAQHLASCGECHLQLEELRHRTAQQSAGGTRQGRTEMAASNPMPEPALIGRAEASVAIQRPMPAWFQWAALLVLASVVTLSLVLVMVRVEGPGAAAAAPDLQADASPAAHWQAEKRWAPQGNPWHVQVRPTAPPNYPWPTQAPYPARSPWYNSENHAEPAVPDAAVRW